MASEEKEAWKKRQILPEREKAKEEDTQRLQFFLGMNMEQDGNREKVVPFSASADACSFHIFSIHKKGEKENKRGGFFFDRRWKRTAGIPKKEKQKNGRA